MRDILERYRHEVAAVVDALPLAALTQAAEMLHACYLRGGTVFILGNGGSAATASHFACDLAKGTRCADRPAFRVIPLTDNVPLLTAWANDTDFSRVFAEPLAALVRPGDVVILISASGNSPNVLAAVPVAQAAGASTIAFTGRPGGKLARGVGLPIRIAAGSIEQVEDAHVVAAHSLCVALRARLQRDETPAEVNHRFEPPVEPIVLRAVP